MAWYVVAEVMDKEPSLVAVIVIGLAAAVLGSSVAMIRWWLSLLASLSAFFVGAAILSELWDPFVGPAIRTEAGPLRFWLANFAWFASVVAPAVSGFVARNNRASEAPRETCAV